MTALAFDLIAGRFHATGWDHHVNEGTIEWPPSPWRILRTLVAASYKADVPAAAAQALIGKLTGLPVYRVPAATAAHVRHYMPIDGDKTTKVFDAFAAVGRVGAEGGRAGDRLVVSWPDVSLSRAERSLLETLCRHIGYLGRAESWVLASVVDEADGVNVTPLADDVEGEHEVRLQALVDRTEYAEWQQRAAASAPKKVRVPQTWWDALHVDTGTLYRDGWSRAPGTRVVRYKFDRPPFERPKPAPRRRREELPTTAIYAIQSPVLPSVTATLRVAEWMRRALMSKAGPGPAPPVLSGHDFDQSDGDRNHGHVLVLPRSQESSGRIDEIVVHARSGFSVNEQQVLERVRRLFGRQGHELDLVLVGLGTLNTLSSPLLKTSSRWRSVTPFVPFRHTKVRQGNVIDGIEDQVRLAASRWFEGTQATLVDVRPIQATRHAWYRFQTRRTSGGGARGNGGAQGFELRFDEPVSGPICLGYGAHFGLGLFEPVAD